MALYCGKQAKDKELSTEIYECMKKILKDGHRVP